MTSSEIREKYLTFFKERGHVIVPSAPIVIKNDPTLMFTNAGMNQFKDFFLGNRQPNHHRIADTQKCLRVSGKHNDLEEVGVDTYHHTMFEMLGNWSIGDPLKPSAGYFKKEAISWSFELLHQVYGIPIERMFATVFEGDPSQGIPMDAESFDHWKQYLPESQILFGSKKDNFWEMGDTGPCGPCTEIHVDCRSIEEQAIISGKDLVNRDHPQVIEIWNNVFIQFNRMKDGSLEKLPANHVDTGMGFERLVRVLQHKSSNYDTDVFMPFIEKIEEITGKIYGYKDTKEDIAFRVLADHIRAISFTIADGQLPSNTGAGYVIRRILRRAVRYYFSYLDYKQPLLCQLVSLLGSQFANVFPELEKQAAFVEKVIKEEELSFLRTLDSGIKRFEQILEESNDIISGEKVFELMDTYGFPVDLSRLMAKEQNREIDEKGFDTALAQQKARSRASSLVDHDNWVEIIPTNQLSFVGYDELEKPTRIVKYRKFSQKDTVGFQIVLESTPFYAESGGQVGDKGQLIVGDEVIEVINTKKENELIVHLTAEIPADPTQFLIAKVDAKRRQTITLHHTATHLLHAALRQVLGKHVAQKGSLVAPDYLRFDFSHFAKVSNEEIKQIEALVNQKIRANIPVVIRSMSNNEAIESGAMALFGEKYGDIVRVVTIDPNYSMELCGGTHVANTGELGIFKIVSESAVAAGVRRIEALTGLHAELWLDEKLNNYHQLLDVLGNPKEPDKKVEQITQSMKSLEKSLEVYKLQAANQLQKELLDSVISINNIKVIHGIVDIDDAKIFKTLAHNLLQKLNSGIVILGNKSAGKAQLQINLSEDVSNIGKLHAGNLVKKVSQYFGGGGGGQSNQASAGGDNPAGLSIAIDEILKSI